MARRLARLPLLPTRHAPEPPEGGGSGMPSTATHRSGLHHTPLGGARRRQRSQRLLANRAVSDPIVSLAGTIGGPVRNQAGAEIGRLGDVVCRRSGEEMYPPVTG